MGEENAPDNAPSRSMSPDPSKRASGVLSLGLLYRKPEQQHLRGGGGNVPDEEDPKPVLGRDVLRDMFLPPLFPPPPPQ